MLEGGVKKVLGIVRGGSKKFSCTKIEIFQPPHQGIYERSLSFMSVRDHITYATRCMMYKVRNKIAPSYIDNQIKQISTVYSRNTKGVSKRREQFEK